MTTAVGPCFDPTCECCTTWDQLLTHTEERIEVLTSGLRELLTGLPSKDLFFDREESYHVCEHGCTLLRTCDYHRSIQLAKEALS